MKTSRAFLALACVAACTVVASGFGARFGLWDFRFGFVLLRWAAYAGIALALLALVALLIPRVRTGHAVALAGALLVAAATGALPLYWQYNARAAPPINDITTDPDDPPAFVALLPLRAGAPVGSDHQRHSRCASCLAPSQTIFWVLFTPQGLPYSLEARTAANCTQPRVSRHSHTLRLVIARVIAPQVTALPRSSFT